MTAFRLLHLHIEYTLQNSNNVIVMYLSLEVEPNIFKQTLLLNKIDLPIRLIHYFPLKPVFHESCGEKIHSRFNA